MSVNLILSKTRFSRQPASEYAIILHSFVLTQYWHVTEGRMDRNALAKTVPNVAACCTNALPMFSNPTALVIAPRVGGVSISNTCNDSSDYVFSL